MTPIGSVLPLIALGVGAVAAMLLAPLAGLRLVRGAASVALLAALGAVWVKRASPVVSGTLVIDDPMARFGVALVCLAGLGALAFLRPSLPAREGPALLLLASLGAALLCGANHAATLFLGLELVTLALIGMFVLPLTKIALEAGYKLLILGAIGAAVLLMALELAYAGTGSLTLQAWSGRGVLVSLAAALLLAGLGFKFALVPFHMWTPDGFAGSPAAAAAVAGVGSKIGVAVVLLRLDAAQPPDPAWHLGLALIGGASILLGNLQAMRQSSLPRMLGYSSIAHSGYLAVIVGSGAVTAPEAVLFYLASYAPALIAALCVAALLGPQAKLDHLRGLIWRSPLMGTAVGLALLSLAGLPVSVGFFGKFYLFAALIRAEAWGVLAVAIVGAAVGVYVYIRFATVVFRPGQTQPKPTLPWPEAAFLALCSAGIVIFGIFPGPLTQIVRAVLP